MIYRLTIETILAAAIQSSIRPIINPKSIINDATNRSSIQGTAYFG
jgi:hypothetical protein